MDELEKVFSLTEAKLWYEKFAGTIVAVKNDVEKEIHSIEEAIEFYGNEVEEVSSKTDEEEPIPDATA